MSRLAEYISSLSPEERKRFAEAIQECQDREIEVSANAEAAERAVRELDAKNQQVMESLRLLYDKVADLHLRVVPSKGGVS